MPPIITSNYVLYNCNKNEPLPYQRVSVQCYFIIYQVVSQKKELREFTVYKVVSVKQMYGPQAVSLVTHSQETQESLLPSFTSPTFCFSLSPFSSCFISDLTTCPNLSCPCHQLICPQDGSNLTGLPLRGFSVSFQDSYPIMQPESFKNENLIVILPFLCSLIAS